MRNISYLRVISTLMVVLFHCLCFYTHNWNYANAIYVPFYQSVAIFLNSLDMPMFVMLSGFLYCIKLQQGKYQTYKTFLANKTQRLLIPFLAWSLIVCYGLTEKSFGEFIIGGASHLWFLGMLFLLFCVIHPFRNVILKNTLRQDVWVLAIGTIISVLMLKAQANPGFIVRQVLHYFYVFYLGIMVGKHSEKLDAIFQHYGGGKLLVTALAILAITTAFPSLREMRYIQKILCPAIVVMAFLWSNKIAWKESKIVSLLDSCSMGIYLVHHVLIVYLLSFTSAQLFLAQYPFMPLLLFPVVLLISLAFTYLLKSIPLINKIMG